MQRPVERGKERVPEPSETERARRRGEEPYSRTATTPDGGIAKGSPGYGMRSRRSSSRDGVRPKFDFPRRHRARVDAGKRDVLHLARLRHRGGLRFWDVGARVTAAGPSARGGGERRQSGELEGDPQGARRLAFFRCCFHPPREGRCLSGDTFAIPPSGLVAVREYGSSPRRRPRSVSPGSGPRSFRDCPGDRCIGGHSLAANTVANTSHLRSTSVDKL